MHLAEQAEMVRTDGTVGEMVPMCHTRPMGHTGRVSLSLAPLPRSLLPGPDLPHPDFQVSVWLNTRTQGLAMGTGAQAPRSGRELATAGCCARLASGHPGRAEPCGWEFHSQRPPPPHQAPTHRKAGPPRHSLRGSWGRPGHPAMSDGVRPRGLWPGPELRLGGGETRNQEVPEPLQAALLLARRPAPPTFPSGPRRVPRPVTPSRKPSRMLLGPGGGQAGCG